MRQQLFSNRIWQEVINYNMRKWLRIAIRGLVLTRQTPHML